ncbi:trypsin-like serine peptidase [Streptomyces sp. NPDC088725]|uniref:trypsin-like serine peptidase n=1 Tax=Streptomyces sp. NPDC088725 TaxID=3365873 RepID=UPI003810F349
MRRAATLFSTLALAATGCMLGTAHAAPAGTSAAAATGSHSTSVSAADQQAALRFWTPERLRGAREMTAPASRTTTATPATAAPGAPVVVPPLAAPASAAAASTPGVGTFASSPTAWTGGGLISTTVGKVFFQRADGGTFACSATVANSDNKSVVLTAGHCVVDAGTGEVYRNWVFIPGYANGNRPFGTFTATRLFNVAQYVSTGGNANWDFAFAALGQVNGRSVANTVGAEGIAFNSATGRHTHSFGYGGSDAEGNGERLNHCEGDEFPDAGRAGSTMWGIDCVQSGGSSGGGFLADFDTSTGGGSLVGNISVSAGSNEYHPTLGNEALDLYRQAGAA